MIRLGVEFLQDHLEVGADGPKNLLQALEVLGEERASDCNLAKAEGGSRGQSIHDS
jgi:hypothetical protein